jgi:L-lysine 2,3-aminomutase
MNKFKPLGIQALKQTPYWSRLGAELQEAAEVIGELLEFRTNTYVLERLINWDNVPNDPMFRMIFPHPSMLSESDYARLRDVRSAGDQAQLASLVRTIRESMNPQPGGQLTHNVPSLNGRALPGLQHKYPHTVVFLPSAAQTCHAYCGLDPRPPPRGRASEAGHAFAAD